MDDIKVFPFEKGYKHEDFGECVFSTPDFVSFVTTYPPAAYRVQQMWDNGWEVYVQPVKYCYRSAENPDKAYITTYKRRTLK